MKYSRRFNEAFERLMINEGGYVNDPDDPGGETRYGISKRSYPDRDIYNLTVPEAKEIYHRDYWERVKGDQIVGSELAFQVFDMAVNAGVFTASKLLQAIIDAKIDGIIGPKTLRKVDRRYGNQLVILYKLERVIYYCKVVINRPASLQYLQGWINRVTRG